MVRRATLRAHILKNFKILKFSSELEKFKRATHQTPFLCGEFWRSGLKISSEIEIFKRSWFFSRFGPLGKFTMGRKTRYGNSKTLRRVLRTACFSRKRQETVQRVTNYCGSKILQNGVPYSFLYGRILWAHHVMQKSTCFKRLKDVMWCDHFWVVLCQILARHDHITWWLPSADVSLYPLNLGGDSPPKFRSRSVRNRLFYSFLRGTLWI